MCVTSNHWNQIVNAFRVGPTEGTLNISKNQNEDFTFSVSNQDVNHNSNRKLLGELVGENRLIRICREANIDDKLPMTLTKEVVHKIFIGMMDIKKEDLGGNVSNKYKQHMLFNSFVDFEEAFLLKSTTIDSLKIDKAVSSGKGIIGLTEKVLITANHYHSSIAETNLDAKNYRDAEFLTSRVADREFQKNSVLFLHDGYFYVDEIFSDGGAFVSVLRDINGQKPPKIICRGTAMRRSATGNWKTGLNDLLLEVGSMGVKSVWPSLSKYLKDNNINAVEVLGKSLGGAHAQELAVLIEGVLNIKVEKLTTCCSVGVGQKINNLFKREILSKRKTPYLIQVIRNGGSKSEKSVDYIPLVGGEHLGAGAGAQCNIEMVYLGAQEQVRVCSFEMKVLEGIKYFLSSFKKTHCRQTTLSRFYWKKITNISDLEMHLKIGNKLENIRMVIAKTLNVLTFAWLNGRSFEAYYYARVDEAQNRTSRSWIMQKWSYF